MTHYEDGQVVATCGPDIFFDDPPETEPERDHDAMQALISVLFSLGQWAAHDPVKNYAADVVMRKATQSTTNFAREHGVSDSFVRS